MQIVIPPGLVIPSTSSSGGSTLQTIRDYTAGSLELNDAQNVITVNSAASITIPLNLDVPFPVGTFIDFLCISTGPFSGIGTATGVTFSGQPFIIALGQMARIIQVSLDTWFSTSSGSFITGLTNGLIKGDGSGNISAAVGGTDYIVPGGVGSVIFDTGWIANADAGSKTTSIPTNVSASAAITALDPTSSLGLANLFAYYTAAAEKIKAIEAALSAQLLPNA